jgi:hypothetical protein
VLVQIDPEVGGEDERAAPVPLLVRLPSLRPLLFFLVRHEVGAHQGDGLAVEYG